MDQTPQTLTRVPTGIELAVYRLVKNDDRELLGNSQHQGILEAQHRIVATGLCQHFRAIRLTEMTLLVMLVDGDIGADLDAIVAISWRRRPTHVVVHGDACLRVDDRLDCVAASAERRFLTIAQKCQMPWNVVVWRQVEEDVLVAEDVVGWRMGECRVVPVEVGDELS